MNLSPIIASSYILYSVCIFCVRACVRGPAAAAVNALCACTVRDVKPAWRSRWLRHRSLSGVSTSAFSYFHVLCRFFLRRNDGRCVWTGGRGWGWCRQRWTQRGCSIPGASRRRPAVADRPWDIHNPGVSGAMLSGYRPSTRRDTDAHLNWTRIFSPPPLPLSSSRKFPF